MHTLGQTRIASGVRRLSPVEFLVYRVEHSADGLGWTTIAPIYLSGLSAQRVAKELLDAGYARVRVRPQRACLGSPGFVS